MSERLAVGRISTVHGLRGECVVEVLSETPERFDKGSVLYAGDSRALTVRSSRPHKARLLVAFDEVPDRSAAESLRGVVLTIDAGEAAPLPDGSYYAHQIEGLVVLDESGTTLGTLGEVLESPAHDIWMIRTPDDREVLVPAVDEFVRSVDLDGGVIVLSPIGGMFD